MTVATPVDPVEALAQHARAIRRLGQRVIADVIEIGLRLTTAKVLAGHGNWLSWLESELGWTERTAQRYMRAHELSIKYDTVSDLDLPIGALHLLARPSTPPAARDAIIERAQAGETLPLAEVNRVIAETKAPTRTVTVQRNPAPPPRDPDALVVQAMLLVRQMDETQMRLFIKMLREHDLFAHCVESEEGIGEVVELPGFHGWRH
jgi:Protein of unknown function (DUF3102)